MSPFSPSLVACLAVVATVGVRDAGAADWPMWRYDAGRTADSPGTLPAQLHPQWVRMLPPPAPAWPPDQHKIQFDAGYEPVVMGKTLFVPSMVSDHLAAWDTDTGEERWRFYTDGPVRFAPVAWRGKVYFVCDDGYLYCLDADRGTLVWKHRGGPSDRKVLGNDRLISAWPARGAPVLYDGTIYFGASIWPFMGIFVHALDAATGEAVWTNSGSGSIYVQQQHHSEAFAGVAPQGYLAATEDRLLISGGRTVPAAYDRRTGKYLYFHVEDRTFGKDAGGYAVSAIEDKLFNGGVMYNLADGAGLLHAPASVLTGSAMIGADGQGHLLAHDYRLKEEEFVDKQGKKQKRPALQKLWEAATDPPLTRLFIKAGARLYGSGADGLIAAVDFPHGSGPATTSWQTRIDGDVWSMIAADHKLFVVTRQGAIYCFGARPTPPRTISKADPSHGKTPVNAAAREILKQTNVTEGYCLVLGAADGDLIEGLARQSDLHIIVFDPDEKKVAALRERLDAGGLYGRRIAVHVGDITSAQLPPYLASLIVSPDPKTAGLSSGEVFVESVFRCLRPYGGVAYLATTDEQRAALVQHLASANGPQARFDALAGGPVLLTRAGALPGSADWTHQYADAANSVVSRDTLVKAPLGLLWFGGPSNAKVLPRHGHGPSPQVVGGRLFIEGPHVMRAVDVYTGRLLWEREIKDIGKFYDNTNHQPGANEIGSNYVSMPDGIYVMTPQQCLRLDPATGRTVKVFSLPPRDGDEPPRWGRIAVWQDLLVATASPIAVPIDKKDKRKEPAEHTVPVIQPHAEWQYLAGAHPTGPWTQVGFTESDARKEGWKTGRAGFGYGDDDDETILEDMRGRYRIVYIRKAFNVDNVGAIGKLALIINYDDAFIAYLNGEEVVRRAIASGHGPNVSGVDGHEAEGYETFEIKDPGRRLRHGANVLAIEGHNVDVGSSDFTLDPHLAIMQDNGATTGEAADQPRIPLQDVPGVSINVDYAAASATLVVMDRHRGEILWSRPASYGFRHNAVAVGAGRVFCIDGLSEQKRASLRRRGYRAPDKPTLYALDARTGDELWSTTKNVFGTWLGYAEEYDVLVQAGSHGPDRAGDEAGRGLIAYRAGDGDVIWESDLEYSGPVMLHHDTLITQQWALDVKTGDEKKVPHPITGRQVNWFFKRNHGCNTTIASEHLLTFRSAAAGYYDLADDGGTGNLGGFKSGCTSNLIVADGLLNAPDYTRTCTCSYQNQCSLALVHDPEVEMWTFSGLQADDAPVRRVGINFGAPGDRRADDGTLWLEYPPVGGPSPDVPVQVIPEHVEWFRHHASTMRGDGLNWVAASGARGLRTVRITLAKEVTEPRACTVRLHFADTACDKPGQRVFNVALQGRPVLTDFDIVKEAGSAWTAVVKEFKGILAGNTLELTMSPAGSSAGGEPILCGIEIIAE